MFRYSLFLFFSFFSLNGTDCFGQNSDSDSLCTVKLKLKTKLFETDRLGNILAVDENNILFSFDENGRQKFKFADKRYGNIASVDASNPLNILVYFNDYNVVKILDNTLSEIKQINLNDYFIGAEKLCMTNDNNLWIFDRQSMKFLKINHSGKVLYETNVLNDLGLADFSPLKIKEKDNSLFALSTDKILMFDNFGQMTKKIMVNDASDFIPGNNKIIVLTKQGVEMFSLNFPDSYKVSMPKSFNLELAKCIRLEKNRWYFQYAHGIDWVNR